MADGMNQVFVASHVVPSMPAMVVVVVHHIAQKAVEEIKPAFRRCVGGFKSQMPFSDDRIVIACQFQLFGQHHSLGIQISPAIRRMSAYHTSTPTKSG